MDTTKLTKALGVLEYEINKVNDDWSCDFDVTVAEHMRDALIEALDEPKRMKSNDNVAYKVEKLRDIGALRYGIVNGDGKPLKKSNGQPLLFGKIATAKAKATLLNA